MRTLQTLNQASVAAALLLTLCTVPVDLAAAGEPVSATRSAPAREPLAAFDAESAAVLQMLTNQSEQLQTAQPEGTTSEAEFHPLLWLAVIAGGIVVMRWLAPRVSECLSRRYDPWKPAQPANDPAADASAFAKFAEEFAGVSVRADATGAAAVAHSMEAEEMPAPVADPVREFLRAAPKELAAMRNVFFKIGAAAEPGARRELLEQLQRAVFGLKTRAEMPSLLAFWQMTGALEGLLAHLAARPEEATPSALRSVAAGLDLLQTLCSRKLKPDLVSDPPVRVLGVDDDPVCRQVLSCSLKKVLGTPDLASEGVAALALAEKVAYDVILLDINMPGMDGFELCGRLAATELNRATPVVFVTCHSDFDSRKKSCLSGGRDLLGKPFLTFELALKAHTMIIQRRLQAEPGQRSGVPRVTNPEPAEAATPEPVGAGIGAQG